MTAFRVGRVWSDVAVDGLRRWDNQRNVVAAQFRTEQGTLHEAAAVRQQVLGYLDSEETFIPIRWETDPSVSGFYRVLSANATPLSSVSVNGLIDFDMQLEQVQGFAAPLFESVMLGAQRTDTSTSVPTPRAFHALPATVRGYETGVLTPSQSVVPSETGDVVVFHDPTNVLFNARPQFFVPPEDWYVGASTISVDGSVVVGRQVPNSPSGWVLSNGIVRVVAEPGGWFRTERWDGAMWTNPGVWEPGRRVGVGLGATFPALDSPHTITVLRNTPQSCAIRLTTDAASIVPGSRFAVTIDIELRRGSTIADVVITSRGAYQWGLRTPIPVPWSSLGTGASHGIQGDGFIAALSDVQSALDVEGVARVSVASNSTLANFGIGYPFAGSAVAASHMWCAVQSETVTVAAR